MKQSKVVPLVLSALALLSVPAIRVTACSCLPTSPCEAFGKAKAVFVGRMIGGSEKVGEGKTTEGALIVYEAGEVRFVVEQAFKGAIGGEITVYVDSLKGTGCEYGMIRGERYIVYLGNKDRLWDGPCSRTHLVAKDDVDLSFLRALSETGTGGRLSARILVNNGEDRPPALSGVKVVVQDENKKRIEVTTDSEGYIELTGLKPGKYQVEPVWPTDYVSARPRKAEVVVSDRDCTSAYFEAKSDNRISGRVYDINERPVSVPVYLAPVAQEGLDRELVDNSDEDGEFEIRGAPPGRYHLYFVFLGNDGKDQKRYFYPGVTKPEEAAVINIAMGEKLEGYDFKMPHEFGVRTVEGQVLLPDGSPAGGVMVMLLCPQSNSAEIYMLTEHWSQTTVTDKQGHFKLKGFMGMTYWIEALGVDPVLMHSEMRQLTLREDLTDVNVLLALPGVSSLDCPEKLRRKN